MKPPLVIAHRDCADGAGAALAAYMKFGESAVYFFAAYGEPPPTDEEVRDRDVFVLDFAYDEKEMLRIAEAANSVLLLDHHKSAREELARLPFCWFARDDEASGATMAWRWFYPDAEVPPLLLYIEDRDLWRFVMPSSREINAALDALGFRRRFRLGVSMIEAWDKWEGSLYQDGTAIVRYVEEQAVAAADRAHNVRLEIGIDGTAVASSAWQSEIGHKILERGASLAIIYWASDRGGYEFSLRSTGAVDCASVAVHFGGGGHERAAGFRRDNLPWKTT